MVNKIYNSLYATINPLVLAGKTGVLKVFHEYGQSAHIYLNKGHLEEIEIGRLTGPEAAKILVKWVSISTEFKQGVKIEKSVSKRIDQTKFLRLLASLEKMIQAIQQVVPDNDAKFKLAKKNWKEEKISGRELTIIKALNGNQSVRQLVSDLNMPEFDVLNIISILCKRGLLNTGSSNKSEESKISPDFYKTLKENLLGLVGPVAEVIINNSLAALGMNSTNITQNQLPNLIGSISEDLDEKEKEIFSKWAKEYTV